MPVLHSNDDGTMSSGRHTQMNNPYAYGLKLQVGNPTSYKNGCMPI